MRRIQTLPAPGYVPEDVTPAQAAAMAEQVAMCCAEAGQPTTPEAGPDPYNWTFAGVTDDVLDRARFLVFERWGLIRE